MKEERINVNSDELNRYLAQAHQLRSRALADMSGQIFKFPQKLLHRFSATMTHSAKTIRQA